MKKLYILTSLIFIVSSFSAQELFTCYDEWKKVFENRGAHPVNDGVHDKIVTIIRTDKSTECFTARVVVRGGVVTELALYFDDESYEKVEYEFKKDFPWPIKNGMSRTRVTTDDEMITIMFTDKIMPKKKKLKSAPKPDFDLN